MPELKIDDLTETTTGFARDAFYVTVGAGVLAFQKAQVRRREIQKLADGRLDDAREQAEKSFQAAKSQLDTVNTLVEDRVKLVEERLGALEERLESVLGEIEDRLPEQARDLVKQARDLVGRAA